MFIFFTWPVIETFASLLSRTKAQMLPEKPHHCTVFSLSTQAIDDDCNQTGQMTAGFLDWPQVRPECGLSAGRPGLGAQNTATRSLPFWREAGVKLDACSSGQKWGRICKTPGLLWAFTCPFPILLLLSHTQLSPTPRAFAPAVLQPGTGFSQITSRLLTYLQISPQVSPLQRGLLAHNL